MTILNNQAKRYLSSYHGSQIAKYIDSNEHGVWRIEDLDDNHRAPQFRPILKYLEGSFIDVVNTAVLMDCFKFYYPKITKVETEKV